MTAIGRETEGYETKTCGDARFMGGIILSNWSQRRSWSGLPPVMLTAGVLVALHLSNGTADAARVDFCRQTSKKARRSCLGRAQSDYLLALAKCDNAPDPAARKACQGQALADRNDAKQTCKDQFDARQTVCNRLGGAPYDPVIDPTNYVTTIDNPYFPLTPGTTRTYVAGDVRQVVAVTITP